MRNQGGSGVQQALRHAGWSSTSATSTSTPTNGYDFGVLFDTPIVFPVAWDHSRIDGFTGRVNLVEHRGFSAFVVMAHTNAIFSPPARRRRPARGAARRLPDRPRSEVQRDDQPAVHLRQGARRVGGAQLALRLRPGRRLGARLRDGADAHGRPAGRDRPVLRQHRGDARRADHELRVVRTAARRGCVIPADGTEDDVTNPPRIAPRHLFDLGLGVDNLFHGDKAKVRAAVQRRQPDEQGGALQLPLDVQRHALRHAARVPGAGRRHVLTARRPRPRRRHPGRHSGTRAELRLHYAGVPDGRGRLERKDVTCRSTR